MERKIKLSTKIRAMLLVMILIVGIGSAYELTLTDTKIQYDNSPLTQALYDPANETVNFYGNWSWTNNTYYGVSDKIVTTRGKIYEPTESNLQRAINDMGGDTGNRYWGGGTVYVGADIDMNNTIYGKSNVKVDFQGHSLHVYSDVDVFNVSDCENFDLCNVVVNRTGTVGVTFPYTSTVLTLYAEGSGRCFECDFENIHMNPGYFSNAGNYTMIKIHMVGANSIAENSFRNIRGMQCDKLIHLRAEGSGNNYGWHNEFQHIWGGAKSGMIYFDLDDMVTGSGFYRNNFYDVKCQSHDYTVNGVYNISSSGNTFIDCHVWDWAQFTHDRPCWTISGNGSRPAVDTLIMACLSVGNDVQDNGENTMIISNAQGYRNINLNNSIYNPVYPTNDDIVLDLPFSENEGDYTYDQSRYGNDGTLYDTSWATGKYGHALEFDNTSSYVDCGSDDSLDIEENFTIMCWVKWDGVESGEHDVLFSTTNAWDTGMNVRISSTGSYVFRHNDDGTTWVAGAYDELPIGEWTHLAWSYTHDGNFLIYKNGRENSASLSSGASADAFTDFEIGRLHGSGKYFDGKIDEFKFYDRAMDRDELRQHWLYGTGIYNNRVMEQNLIYTSQGKTYTPSCLNVEKAIWDFNSTDGGTIWLPDFDFNVTEYGDSIDVENDNLRIVGSEGTTFHVSDDTLAEVMYIHADHVTIENIRFVGWESHTKWGLNMDEGDYCEIVDCYFTQLYRTVYVDGDTSCDHLKIRNNDFEDIEYQAIFITSDAEYCEVTGNHIYNGAECNYGIYLKQPYAICANNIIENLDGDGGGGRGIYVYDDDIIVDSNLIVACSEFAIATVNPAENITITNNIIEDTPRGISCTHPSGIISDNQFHDCDKGIWMFAGTTTSELLITNNRFSDCDDNTIRDDDGKAVIYENIGYVTENGGASTGVNDGGTINHGLDPTPVYVIANCNESAIVAITAIGADTFTVSIKDHAGNGVNGVTIYWRAYYKP